MPNRVRFDGTAQRFYEVWYTIFNDLRSGDGYWIRYTLLNPLDSHPEAGAALWFAYTCRADPSQSFAVKRGFPRGEFEAPPAGTRVQIGSAILENGRFSGELEAEGRSVKWDLHYTPAPEPHYYFRGAIRRFAERRNSVTLPNPRIFLSGDVRVDGQRAAIQDAPGHQAHHWGVERARSWRWAHCCAFENEEATLELLSGEGPGGIEVTFVNLYTHDEVVRCDALGSLLRNSCVCGLGFWKFEGWSDGRRVVADLHVDPVYVQKFVYVSPAYRSSECWNTQTGDGLVRVYGRDGRVERTLRARGTVAAETHDERLDRIPYRSWSGA